MGCRERTETGQAPVVGCMVRGRQGNAGRDGAATLSANGAAAGHPRHGNTTQTPSPGADNAACGSRSLGGKRPLSRRVAPRFPPLRSGVLPLCRQKKSPDHYKMIRGCPGLSTYRRRFSDPRRKAVSFQAGILTPGSSSHRVFPTEVSDCSAMFVPGYSGGPVSDFHGVPNYSPKGT